MSRKITPLGIVILVTIGFATGILTMVISNIQRGESLHKAYERGYEDARSALLDTLYNRWFNDSLGWGSIDSTDTLPMKYEATSHGVVTLYSTEFDYWYNTVVSDSTEKDWHGWEISEELARSWYDGVDSTHTTYEDALQDWAISVLLRESKFTIYFYPTGTILGPAVESVSMLPIILWDTGGE